MGKTVLKYFAKDEGMLSFSNNKQVKIFSKGAGSRPELWGVMVRIPCAEPCDSRNCLDRWPERLRQ